MPAKATRKDKEKEDAKPTVLRGVYMLPNGDKYDGEYSRSEEGVLERNGYGEHTTSEGTVYQGNWENDKMNGHGKLMHPSGAIYEGDFVNNQFTGKGRYTWPDGSYYDGPFIENRMEGEGEFTDTDSQVWTGTFRYKAAPGLKFKLGL
ncbi:uncharacterized protein LOC100366738 [Saccoglossus kowalevskii]|uniref:MORN repeat-containing protein 2-like n=1 Tax=Saccoglossus kowalevskii TaxID=10224 RepID=A0ABM0GJ85_SACKO|nr:PREDICTED: MORN repeat-containing protein 2-like [Saccoglossus kowalevskii]